MKLQNPQPKVKGNRLQIKEINFPIPVGDSSAPWPQFRGIFVGTSVIIENMEDAALLHHQGLFGKCMFSRSWPTNEKPPVIRKRQWIRRKEWLCNIEEQNSIDNLNRTDLAENKNKKSNYSLESKANVRNGHTFKFKNDVTHAPSLTPLNKIVVVNDSDDDCLDKDSILSNLNPTLHEEPTTIVEETVCLSLEEAFFLFYALNCLSIKHMTTNKMMSLDGFWKLCINADPTFVEKYVTYHYFRSKGWIVKSGLNFGCDFAIYKRGPLYYHASCGIKIRNINNPNKPKLSWENLMGYCRATEAAKKGFVLCEVTWPSNVTTNTCNIKDVRKFIVQHKILQRWTATEHRERIFCRGGQQLNTGREHFAEVDSN
uniref:tRNA-intron lyase n=1 Tax=Cacopsylla melanoneura TaxID=428564 RepID=A0A8D8YR05_9HEMI